jgi:crotonobetainyl-CoA:carnitine CoA-transferase CaiB-like acyl-CoA transferase
MPFIFHAHNRSKRSVAVNLKSADGVDVVKRLAATSDVFVQSMRPGAAEGLGLSRDALCAPNPRLIYASFSAFGARGPRAHRRGVDGVAQSESGLAAVQNRVLGNTNFIDGASGLALSQAILIALMNREKTGVASTVDLCLLDTAVFLQSAPLAEFSVSGAFVDQSSHDSRYPAVGVYRAADGRFYMAPFWDDNWHAICDVLDRPDLADDERFKTKADRGRNATQLHDLLESLFSGRPRDFWVERLDAAGVIASRVQSFADVLTDPQLLANDSFEEFPLPSGETATYPRAPFRFAGRPLSTKNVAPVLGDSTDSILGQIGIDAADRDRLASRGVIARTPRAGNR